MLKLFKVSIPFPQSYDGSEPLMVVYLAEGDQFQSGWNLRVKRLGNSLDSFTLTQDDEVLESNDRLSIRYKKNEVRLELAENGKMLDVQLWRSFD